MVITVSEETYRGNHVEEATKSVMGDAENGSPGNVIVDSRPKINEYSRDYFLL